MAIFWRKRQALTTQGEIRNTQGAKNIHAGTCTHPDTYTLETVLQKINVSLSVCSRVRTIKHFPLCLYILDLSLEVVLTCGWRERSI